MSSQKYNPHGIVQKDFKTFLILLFWIFQMLPSVAQNDCYIQLDEASGFDVSPFQAELDAKACELVAAFPDSTYADSFKVFGVGFYAEMAYYDTYSYPQAFLDIKDMVAGMSPYYLLIGRQSDPGGVFTKFWVDVKLPEGEEFSCMSDLQRVIYSARVRNATEEKYSDINRQYYEYLNAEIAGMYELQNIIEEIKECCIPGRTVGCEGCNDELANSYFELTGFKTLDIPVTISSVANISTSNLKDISNFKFNSGGQLDYLGSHFADFISDVNEKVSFNLLVSSNQTFCQNYFDSLELFMKQSEFGCWINFGTENSGISKSFINVVWNQDKSICIKDPELADLIIEDIYCYIYSELEIISTECSVVIPPSPPPYCPYDIPITSELPDGGLTITQFIQLIRNEEAKYTEAEQEDTKSMVTRFRKLFYGSPAWDQHLIPGAANVSCIKPYEIKKAENSRKKVNTWPSFIMVDMGYFPVDPETNTRPQINAVTSPGMLAPQTQEVRLEVGSHANYLVDIGHVLCGMDAFFHQQSFTFTLWNVPIGGPLKVERNLDAVTWVGDLSSAQAEIAVKWINLGRDLWPSESQTIINHYSSAPDMLGDIDGIVIGSNYCNNNSSLKKISDILEHYYLGEGVSSIQEHRYSLFSQNIGLIWDPIQNKFSNFKEMVEEYNDQVNDAACYYVAGQVKDAGGVLNLVAGGVLALKLSINWVSKKLLWCFFEKLEEAIPYEQ